jgi:hypothetical protein
MNDDQSWSTRVTVSGPLEARAGDPALASLCAAVERTVEAYRPPGLRVREVVVMLEEGGPATATLEPPPVYVDVYDSGYGHGI